MRKTKQILRRRDRQRKLQIRKFALRDGFHNSSFRKVAPMSNEVEKMIGNSHAYDYMVICRHEVSFADSLESASCTALFLEQQYNDYATITGPDGRRFRIGADHEPHEARPHGRTVARVSPNGPSCYVDAMGNLERVSN